MAKSKKVSMPYGEVAVEHRPRSRVTLNLDKKHGSAMPSVKIGSRHRMTVDGKVTSLSSDEYGHRVELDVRPDGISHDGGASSIIGALRQRRRSREGRFE